MGEMIVFAAKMITTGIAVAAVFVLVFLAVNLLGGLVFNSVVGEFFALIQMWLPFDLGSIWGFVTLAVGVFAGIATYTVGTTLWRMSKDA